MTTSTNFFFNKMNRWADGSFSIVPFLLSVGVLIVGLVFFAEDTKSSYEGFMMLERTYDLRLASWPYTYWAISIMPQIAQMFFFCIYLTDTKDNKAALAFSIGFALFDITLDTIYRSKGYMGGYDRMGAVGFTTFVFSILSEPFISISLGFIFVMFQPVTQRLGLTGGESGSVHRGRSNRGTLPTSRQRDFQPSESEQINELFHSGGRQ